MEPWTLWPEHRLFDVVCYYSLLVPRTLSTASKLLGKRISISNMNFYHGQGCGLRRGPFQYVGFRQPTLRPVGY